MKRAPYSSEIKGSRLQVSMLILRTMVCSSCRLCSSSFSHVSAFVVLSISFCPPGVSGGSQILPSTSWVSPQLGIQPIFAMPVKIPSIFSLASEWLCLSSTGLTLAPVGCCKATLIIAWLILSLERSLERTDRVVFPFELELELVLPLSLERPRCMLCFL